MQVSERLTNAWSAKSSESQAVHRKGIRGGDVDVLVRLDITVNDAEKKQHETTL
jgi:hypothetical protein